MTDHSRHAFLALLSLPLLIQLVAIVTVGSLSVPRGVSRPIVIVAIVVATLELLRFVEALIRRNAQVEPPDSDDDEPARLDIWEAIGEGFVSLGGVGMSIYVLTCAACMVGFALSIGVQTVEDAARNAFFTQSEATLLAALSMAALMLEVRIAFIRQFGWPFD